MVYNFIYSFIKLFTPFYLFQVITHNALLITSLLHLLLETSYSIVIIPIFTKSSLILIFDKISHPFFLFNMISNLILSTIFTYRSIAISWLEDFNKLTNLPELTSAALLLKCYRSLDVASK